jgi:hypothetical protein
MSQYSTQDHDGNKRQEKSCNENGTKLPSDLQFPVCWNDPWIMSAIRGALDIIERWGQVRTLSLSSGRWILLVHTISWRMTLADVPD